MKSYDNVIVLPDQEAIYSEKMPWHETMSFSQKKIITALKETVTEELKSPVMW